MQEPQTAANPFTTVLQSHPQGFVSKKIHGLKGLKNLFERHSHQSAQAMINLHHASLPQQVDSSYLKKLHQEMFQGIFEDAGHTRDERPSSLVESTVSLSSSQTVGWKKSHENNNEVKEGLQSLDQQLTEKNDLKNLQREDFVEEITNVFNTLNRLHPFRKGNQITQRLFCEKLGQAAGHPFSFSLVTEERMTQASTAVGKDQNLQPMLHLFEDITHPQKAQYLKTFMDQMKEKGHDDIQKHPVMVAKEGTSYTGTYHETNSESFMINVQEAYILGNKEHLTPEQRKTVKTGDTFTFTAPTPQELKSTLIPSENLAPLTKNAMAELIAEDARIHTCSQQIQKLSKTVFGNEQALNRKMVEVIQNPSLGYQLANQLEKSPGSFSSLAGFDLCGIKNAKRTAAEESASLLFGAMINLTHAVYETKKDIIKEHKEEQERCSQAIATPSEELQTLLSLPKTSQRAALEASPTLQKELSGFVKQLNQRLSSNEHKAIRHGDHTTLASSLGVSENKAKDITDIVQRAKETHQEVHTKIRTVHQNKTLALAS
ncbi:BID domain-containing T4SS effector [Bartonella raoultii]|uniref:protein adenylyltransferase n=1 Tax=Bartonella raoultii TaxID=1457020 RepID=A0ABS7I5B7_9HYPH|nr:BID domain-containing T4SS effector [Bartonella raoultii]MBX4335231.1 BID domain-containing T4SS effector [Bartonella raoultii]